MSLDDTVFEVLLPLQVVKMPSAKKTKKKKPSSTATDSKYQQANDQPPPYDSICPDVPPMMTGASAASAMTSSSQAQPQQQQLFLDQPYLDQAQAMASQPQQVRPPGAGSMDEQRMLTSCRYADVSGGGAAGSRRQVTPPTATQSRASPGSVDLELDHHIKLESLSPEALSSDNLFDSIDTDVVAAAAAAVNNDLHQSQRAAAAVTSHAATVNDYRQLASGPQSSPTSGYNTMGSSPSVSSPFSLSGYSPQSGGGSSAGYPNSCSPNDAHSMTSSPRRHLSTGSSGHPLSPTHYQAIQQQHQQRLQQQQQQQLPQHPPHDSPYSSGSAGGGFVQQQHQPPHHYPTPPLEHGHHQHLNQQQQQHPHQHLHHHGAGDVFTSSAMTQDNLLHRAAYLTPSPESPGHSDWSSCSNEAVYL